MISPARCCTVGAVTSPLSLPEEGVDVILAVDVGNTQTVLGLFDGSVLRARWRLSTEAEATADELRVKANGLLSAEGFGWDQLTDLVVGSVVPPLTEAYTELSKTALGCEPLLVSAALAPELVSEYDQPRELGADRVADAVAAIAEYGAPVIVVDFGTATTLDVIDARGVYLGGAIAPGVQTSAEALFAKAARLSEIELQPPTRAVGRSTREAMQSGLVLGEAVMVDGLVRRCWSEIGVQTPVVATGGLAARMAPLCETVTAVDADLTLKGLLALWSSAVDSGERPTP